MTCLDVTVWSDTSGVSLDRFEGAKVMKKRVKLPPHKSKKMFSKHADKTHRKNMPMPRKSPMRGGIRL